ncbi:O-antigen ligase family protein [Novosphingobium aquimarinum]|uniref:O-antigen ligase family protein n=1 Tax=Novosphingobium aquimarinum TaxID=2682494 RepID=UPI0018DCE9A5|nr:O-antigen ligase family protein [Novosphingobium aquimarinum]
MPRLSRSATRRKAENPGWNNLLAQAVFAGFLALAMAGPWMTSVGGFMMSQYRTIGYLALFIVALVSVRPWQQPQRLLAIPWPIAAALLYCLLSIFWGLSFEDGLRKIALTAIIVWSLFALIREIGAERTVAILRVVMFIVLFCNYFVVLLAPDVGVRPNAIAIWDGPWRGVMGQKNWAGFACAITVLLCVFDAKRVPIALRIGGGIAAGLFLIFTDSATSMGMCLFALFFGGLFYLHSARLGRARLAAPGWAWAPLAVFAILFITMAVNPQPYFELISDPEAFTGRTQIWAALIKLYVDQPLTGVGFGSIWDIGDTRAISQYASGWIIEQSEGHNGYLDLLVQIGAPGTLLVLFATLVWPLERLLRGGDHPARTLGAALMIFCLGHNFTETTLFDRDTVGQVTIMIAIALIWSVTAIAIPAQKPQSPPSPSHAKRKRRRIRASAE